MKNRSKIKFQIFGINKISIAFIILLSFLTSCKKFLEIPLPKDKLVSGNVFKDDKTATASILGIYSDMMQTFRFIGSDVTFYAGLSSDELFFPNDGVINYYQFSRNEIMMDNSNVTTCWNQGYQYIYYANACIEGLENSTSLTKSTKDQLLGEALFVRAFTYFYLVNLFGDIPMVTTTNYTENAVIGRTPQSEIYNLMINDLKAAQTFLPVAYVTTDRARPNRWAATALLSRVYLYKKDWAQAEAQASSIINSGAYSLIPPASAFLKTSNETIWQLMPVNPSYNTLVANRLVPTNNSSIPVFPLSNELAGSFEPGDIRRTSWVGTSVNLGTTYYYAHKYKVRSGSTTVNEYYNVFRLAEQYLIRSEARAHLQNNLPEAINDSNVIRARAGLSALPVTLSQGQLLNAIEKERRNELFAEWGHRWFDLKRTERLNAVMSVAKPLTWRETSALWPIPVSELNSNPNLTQNPGYN